MELLDCTGWLVADSWWLIPSPDEIWKIDSRDGDLSFQLSEIIIFRQFRYRRVWLLAF